MKSEEVQEVLQKARKDWQKMWPKAVKGDDAIACPLCGYGGRSYDIIAKGVYHPLQDTKSGKYNNDTLVCMGCGFEGDAVELLRRELWEKREAEPTEEELAREVTVRLGARPANIAEYLEAFWPADVEAFKAAEEIKTGFQNLDNVTGGLYPDLYVLGALSSLGKTTFALQMADNLAASGKHVLYFALEQSQFELVSKSLARISAQSRPNGVKYGIDSVTIRRGFADPSVKEALKKYRETIAPRLNVIQGEFKCSADTVRDEVARYINSTGETPLVFIDYLQILQPADGSKQSLRESIDATVTALKRISRDYNTAVIAISSVNRKNYLKPIDFESFKESGGIEYTASVVWGLQYSCLKEDLFDTDKKIKEQRERIQEAKKAIPREIDLVCLKNRYGRDFLCSFKYYPHVDLFEPKETGNPKENAGFKRMK